MLQILTITTNNEQDYCIIAILEVVSGNSRKRRELTGIISGISDGNY